MKKLLVGLIMALTATVTTAQTFTGKDVVIITSFPVGSGPDTLLRKIQPDLNKIWNTPVIVENRPGGNGSIAFNACTKSAKNTQVITLCYTEAAVFWGIPQIYGDDKITRDLKFLSVSHFAPLVLITSTNVNSKQELIEHIKKRPTFGSWSVGSVGQITGQELANQLKIDAEHVPYKDYGQWLLDVSNQNLGYSFPTVGSATPLYRAGRIKFVAMATRERDSLFSDVPTFEEYFGKSNFMPLGAYGAFYVGKGMSGQQEKLLQAGLRKALGTTETKSDMLVRGYRPWNHSDAETRRILTAEQEHYYRALKQFNINVRP